MKTYLEIRNAKGKLVEIVDITNLGPGARSIGKEIVTRNCKVKNQTVHEVIKRERKPKVQVALAQIQTA